MQYSAINIQGNILSGEILEKIRIEDIRFQSQADFGLDKNTTIRDEIGIAWAAARAHWQAFSLRRSRLKDEDSGTSETRQSWMIPFMRELGYELEKSSAETINGKSYAISHRAVNRDKFPVHIVGINQSLDKRPEVGGTRLSPHALVQEYLNNHDHLYALTTNGRFLRLLRDATRLSRLSFLEFDLERIMEEELFAEFALLFRVLHISRMPIDQESGEDAFIDFYHNEALSSGSRIREKLSKAVEESLKSLANGLLKHPANDSLRQEFEQGQLQSDAYYLYLLRLVYRILFLVVIEERHLIYPDKRDEDTNHKRDIYFRYYSINRLTRLAEKRIYVDPRKTDLWKSLLVTFQLFENEAFGEKLGIKPLGSGLFSNDALGSLASQNLDNGTLLRVLGLLVSFENENKQRVRVNYADLDVEEFGSVYEGLLEYDPKVENTGNGWEFRFVVGDKRSSSGSHYTPEELVKPLIKHSLDYIIADRLQVSPHVLASEAKQSLREKQLLSITVCDVACGSGHILLSAARRIATELAAVREGAEQPSPTYYRAALRDTIKNCIYGVDLNPLAVELCKVALWLEAHNPGEPLNFLDHHIKCGNSIVGLAHRNELEDGIANEAFKTLPDDDKAIAKALRDRNTKERKERENKVIQLKAEFEKSTEDSAKEAMAGYLAFNQLPESTPEEIKRKAKAYKQFLEGKGNSFLMTMADAQVAQFFIPKTTDNQDRLMTDSEFRTILSGYQGWEGQKTARATIVARRNHFFHWFLEFPTIMQIGGFDCILGNPPFLGGQKLTGTFGNPFAEYIRFQFAPIGSVDLVTYFFRRNYSLIKSKSFISLISTNTIAQGDARLGGLAEIYKQGGTINHAVRSMKWPGLAAVEVALVTLHKGQWKGKFVLDNKEVNQITTYLDDSIPLGDPYKLKANENKSFQGSIVLGKGFVLTLKEAKELIVKNPKNKDVIFPYLNGDDLNNQVDQSPTRCVINFHDWPLRRYTPEEWKELSRELKSEIEDKIKNGRVIEMAPPYYDNEVAFDYPDCLEIVEKLVRPEREKDKREQRRKFWWLFAERASKLYSTISEMERVLCVSEVTKYYSFSYSETGVVFMHTLKLAAFDQIKDFLLLNSTIKSEWAWKNSSRMGDTTLRYSLSDAFQTFPFPDFPDKALEGIGDFYHNFRQQLMLKLQLGLTKTYNAFHAREITSKLSGIENLTEFDKKTIEKKYGKEVWYLWNHLQKAEGACRWEEAVSGIEELRRLHVEMDKALLEAYGWHEDSQKWGKAIQLAHDFYEVDYLPENDRVRFTISPKARKEVLKRLLHLNHERYEEEIMQGLHKKKDVEKFYNDKGQAVPIGVVFSDGKKSKANKAQTKKTKNISGNDTQMRLEM